MSEDIGSKLTGMLDEPEQPKQEQEAGPVEMDENLLIQDYYRVQSLEITDPGTIRRLARRFSDIANDAALVKQVSFDAAHAALQLYTYADTL